MAEVKILVPFDLEAVYVALRGQREEPFLTPRIP
jgi:hypothetical protein